MKKRLQKEVRMLIILVLIGFAYYGFISITCISIPCIFKMITGLKCPGCGITRMFESLFCLDFKSSFEYNPVVFSTLPIIIGCIAYERIRYIKYGTSKPSTKCNIFLWIELFVLITYGVIRNLV